nr:hypothetical protein [Labilibaculum sp.]
MTLLEIIFSNRTMVVLGALLAISIPAIIFLIVKRYNKKRTK